MERDLLSWLWALVGVHILLAWVLAWRRGVQARLIPSIEFSLEATPLVSILIPAWNERSTFNKTINALKQLTYPTWEAIVIAGGTDQTYINALEILKDCNKFKIICQPPCGKNTALNLGYAQSCGEVIVLLDADCIVEPDWLTHLVAPLTCGYQASLANYFPTNFTYISAEFEMAKVLSYQIEHSSVLHGGGIALQRNLVERIGGFPEKVTVGVDWDLDQRVTRLRAKKVFASKARHKTYLPDTLPNYFRDEIRWRRAHLQAVSRFSDLSLRGIKSTILGLSSYIMGVIFWAAPFVALMLKNIFPWSVQLWLALWVWILLRRSAMAYKVVAYTLERRWLLQIGISPILLVVSFLCGTIALLTLWKRIIFFQGPRPKSL